MTPQHALARRQVLKLATGQNLSEILALAPCTCTQVPTYARVVKIYTSGGAGSLTNCPATPNSGVSWPVYDYNL